MGKEMKQVSTRLELASNLMTTYMRIKEWIADDEFDLIWEELDRKGATVFLHGRQTRVFAMPHELLGVPITEVR